MNEREKPHLRIVGETSEGTGAEEQESVVERFFAPPPLADLRDVDANIEEGLNPTIRLELERIAKEAREAAANYEERFSEEVSAVEEKIDTLETTAQSEKFSAIQLGKAKQVMLDEVQKARGWLNQQVGFHEQTYLNFSDDEKNSTDAEHFRRTTIEGFSTISKSLEVLIEATKG